MDIEGDAVWKWYGSTPSDTNRASGRSASFSGVEAFLSYAANNTGYGLVAAADAPACARLFSNMATSEWHRRLLFDEPALTAEEAEAHARIVARVFVEGVPLSGAT